MDFQSAFVISDVLGTAVAFGDDVVFAFETGGGLFKGFLGFEFAGAEFAVNVEIPVFGKLPGLGQTFFFGADAAVSAGEIGGTLPKAAAGALVDMEFAAQ